MADNGRLAAVRPGTVRRSSVLVSVLALAGLLAPVANAQVASGQGPYLGRMSGDRVRVRTGGSRNHRPFSLLGRGQPIVVLEEQGEWCKIKLPRWIPVYVNSGYVEATPAGGVVTGSNLVVRVEPARRHEPVGLLPRGTRVEVLGREGDWLKIVPPNGCIGWVSRNYVGFERSLRTAEVTSVWASLGGSALPPSTRPAGLPGAAVASRVGGRGPRGGQGVPLPAGLDAPSPVTRGPAREITSSRLESAYETVQRIVSAAPQGRRDYSPAERQFEQIIRFSEDLGEIEQAREGLRYVAGLKARARKVRTIHEILEDARAEDARLREKLVRIKKARFRFEGDLNDGTDSYVSRGWVTSNGRNVDRQGTHRLMKGDKVLYYLQAQEGSRIKLDKYLNRRVGIRGVIRELDPKYGADLVLISDLTVLADR